MSFNYLEKIVPACSVAAGVLLGCSGDPAFALEPDQHPTFFIGASDGLAAGMLPPDGLYVQNMQFYWDGSNKVNGTVQQRNTVFIGDAVLPTWVPGWTLLGGRYSAQMLAAVTDVTVTSWQTPVGTHSSTGLAALLFFPLRLTWELPGHFYMTNTFGFAPPIGKYDPHNAINNGNNFWAYQVSSGITYAENGLKLSLNPHIQWFSENTDSGLSKTGQYQSGPVAWTEFTATQDFGKWTAGVTGEYAKQIEDDSESGVDMHGTKLERLNVGPYVGYDFGPVTVGGTWTRTVLYNNTFGGDYIWLRMGFKIF